LESPIRVRFSIRFCQLFCSSTTAQPDPTIRQTALSSLHECFDKHLAQAENVRSLFIALNDEVFENRITAVATIGRLAKHNPAYVMPSLRKALFQLLTELDYSTVMYRYLPLFYLIRADEPQQAKSGTMHSLANSSSQHHPAFDQALRITNVAGASSESE
jgi:phosphatidylinositol kinase/protein kinase (PI-3  family)